MYHNESDKGQRLICICCRRFRNSSRLAGYDVSIQWCLLMAGSSGRKMSWWGTTTWWNRGWRIAMDWSCHNWSKSCADNGGCSLPTPTPTFRNFIKQVTMLGLDGVSDATANRPMGVIYGGGGNHIVPKKQGEVVVNGWATAWRTHPSLQVGRRRGWCLFTVGDGSCSSTTWSLVVVFVVDIVGRDLSVNIIIIINKC
jgi:hypothetical protein